MSLWWLCPAIILILNFMLCDSNTCSKNVDCINGICKSGQCYCAGNYWWGDFCEYCRERPRNNRSIIVNINEFNGASCGDRRLNIYDGSSVHFPLLAVVSDIISTATRANWELPLLQLRAKSGSAFIVLAGKEERSHSGDCWLNITYSFEEECSTKCHSYGVCSKRSSQTCKCDHGWMSSNCSLPTCPVSCNDGLCDVKTRKCNCTYGFTGESCNITDNRSHWSSPVANNQELVLTVGPSSLSMDQGSEICPPPFSISFNLSQDFLDGVSSHAMANIGNYIWLYGGLTFSKGPLDTLARYNIKENSWEIIQASSQLNQGPSARYDHSMVAFNNSLFVFGGICQGIASNETWMFDTLSRQWSQLDVSTSAHKPMGVVGHTANVVGNEMIVLFGYNPGQGYVKKTRVLDLVTKTWSAKHLTAGGARQSYGHSSVYDPQTGCIYVHGGYRMYNRTYHAPSSDTFCYHPNNNKWSALNSSGVSRYLHSAVLVGNAMIVYGGRGIHRYSRHPLMVFDIEKRIWNLPSDPVLPETVFRYGHSAVEVNSTMYVFGGFRGSMMNSFLEYSLGECFTPRSSLNCFKPLPSLISSADISESHNSQVYKCHLRQSCQECISVDSDESCVWCESNSQCVSKVFYDVTFPYLQCLQSLEHGRGTCSSLQCSEMKSCRDCHLLPGCGWCDDGSGTGVGSCMPGGNDGPFLSPKNVNSTATCSLFNPQTCPKSRWNFIDCPACQCNGHSKCIKGNSCGDCENNTTGPYCEKCTKGHFGNPKNGCKCSVCQCTGHAKSKVCDPVAGICQCVTKGVKGRNCEECDANEFYVGNASNDVFCYFSFELSGATVKSFNLTGFERLSFEYFPGPAKRSVQLEIKWTDASLDSKAMVNLTTFFAKRPEDKEVFKYKQKTVTVQESFQAVFHYQDYEFDHEDKFVLRGYIYDIDSSGSAILTVSFSIPTETINLLEFFLTFFGCFLSLLVVAGVVWKVRNRYVNFIVNRQRREERQKMASRPFAKVPFLLSHIHEKSSAGNIAVETLENGKASVLTVLMLLPADDDGFTPVGQSGICFASVLGTHGDAPGTTPAGRATRIRTRKRCNGTCV